MHDDIFNPVDPLPKVWDPNHRIGDMLRGKRGLVVGIANEHSMASEPPPSQQAARPPTTASGTTPGVGARGAARGAVVGEVVGGDAGAGAAAGAVAARGQSRRQNAAAAGPRSNNSRPRPSSSTRRSREPVRPASRGGATPSSEPASAHCPIPYQGVEEEP